MMSEACQDRDLWAYLHAIGKAHSQFQIDPDVCMHKYLVEASTSGGSGQMRMRPGFISFNFTRDVAGEIK